MKRSVNGANMFEHLYVPEAYILNTTLLNFQPSYRVDGLKLFLVSNVLLTANTDEVVCCTYCTKIKSLLSFSILHVIEYCIIAIVYRNYVKRISGGDFF